MIQLQNGCSIALISAGVFFIFTASVGLIRLPDFYSRTHAVSKADALGITAEDYESDRADIEELYRGFREVNVGKEFIDVTMDNVTYNDPPHRFEAGTPPIVQAIGLGAARGGPRQRFRLGRRCRIGLGWKERACLV